MSMYLLHPFPLPQPPTLPIFFEGEGKKKILVKEFSCLGPSIVLAHKPFSPEFLK